MSQNEPNRQLCLFNKDGQVLSDQNDGSNENISPNWTKAKEREKGLKILLIIRSKNNNSTVYKTKSYLNIFSRYLVKEKESRNIKAIPAGELDTHLSRKQNGGDPSDLSSMERSIQRYLDEQKSQRNILKDNEFQ